MAMMNFLRGWATAAVAQAGARIAGQAHRAWHPGRRRAVAWALFAAWSMAGCGGGGDPVSDNNAANGGLGGSTFVLSAGQVLVDHGGFKLVYDCAERSSVRYDYTLTTDTGTLPRPDAFTVEPLLPPGCAAQTNTASYSSVHAGYDRGHLVTSNHMDGNAAWLAAANHMSNVVPQVSTFNQGLWLDVENVAECYRDVAPVRVIGGLVYNDPSNDYFVASHGVRTPDIFWKLIITSDPATGSMRAIAWLIPNNVVLNALDHYLVSVTELEQAVGADRVSAPALPADLRNTRAASTWARPAGCNLG